MSPAAPALRLFISYSHKDAKLKDQLLEHLDVVRRFEGVDVWTDDRIEPGADWRESIDQGLAEADVALLLVSPSFLASRFIQDMEMPSMITRHASEGLLVIPVIMRDCAWQEHPLIERFQVLPRGAEAITQRKGYSRDRAFMEVATEVARLAKKRANAQVLQRDSDTARTPLLPPPAAVPPPAPSRPSLSDDMPSSRADWTGQINVWEMLGVISNLAVDRREEDLVGRRELLDQLRQLLDSKVGRGVVLFGMTGIGKTWIAQAVASAGRRELRYPGGVFWVPGGSHEEYVRGLASVGVALGRTEESPEEIKIDTARRALREGKEPILLVVDPIDPSAPWVQMELEPLPRSTRLLATTTHAPTGFLHGPGRAQWTLVEALDPDDAHAWVRSLAPRLRPAEVDMLLSFFERHTLALEVAARTLHDDPTLPVARYLDSLRSGYDWTEAPEVTGAGLTALQALRFLSERTPSAARRAWAVSGCYAKAPIPIGWLTSALGIAGLSEHEARIGVKELIRRHLGVRVGDGSGMTLPLHPLVHIVAQTLATDADRGAMAQGIVKWIPGLDDPELHLKVPVAWPHIEAAWEAQGADAQVALRLAALLKHRGHTADLNRARDMLEETIEVTERQEGPNSEAVAAVCNALGCVLMEFGSRKHLEEAERMLRRALTIEEMPLGHESPTVAVRLSNLAMVLKNLGGLSRLEEAEILLRRALDIDENELGEDATSVAVRLSNLAMVLKSLGSPQRLEEAEERLRRAVLIQESEFGKESPTVAVTLSNLAMVLRDLGNPSQLQEAERLLRRVLRIREAVLGPDAPRVAITLHNLAIVLEDLSGPPQLLEAEALLRRALSIEESAQGSNSPQVAATLHNLAGVLKVLGGAPRLEEAIALLERAEEISTHHLGPMHMQTKTISASLERCQRALKKLLEPRS